MKNNREFYVCDCDSPEHLLMIHWEDNPIDGWDTLSFYNAAGDDRTFLDRLKLCIKYLFNKVYVLRASTWVCLNDKDVKRMVEHLNKFLNRYKANK